MKILCSLFKHKWVLYYDAKTMRPVVVRCLRCGLKNKDLLLSYRAFIQKAIDSQKEI